MIGRSRCGRSRPKRAALLLRRAGEGAEGAENATVSFLGAQPGAATCAFIKDLTGVNGHQFAPREAAMWTGDYRSENNTVHEELFFAPLQRSRNQ
jgi:hypothetical protein